MTIYKLVSFTFPYYYLNVNILYYKILKILLLILIVFIIPAVISVVFIEGKLRIILQSIVILGEDRIYHLL